MEKTFSVDDLVGNLWRLGRTPSEANLHQEDDGMAPDAQQQTQPLPQPQPQPQPTGAPSTGSIPRVPSLEMFRKLFGSNALHPPAEPENARASSPPPAPPSSGPVQRPEPLRTADAHDPAAAAAAAASAQPPSVEHGPAQPFDPFTSSPSQQPQLEREPRPQRLQHSVDHGPISAVGSRSHSRKRKRANTISAVTADDEQHHSDDDQEPAARSPQRRRARARAYSRPRSQPSDYPDDKLLHEATPRNHAENAADHPANQQRDAVAFDNGFDDSAPVTTAVDDTEHDEEYDDVQRAASEPTQPPKSPSGKKSGQSRSIKKGGKSGCGSKDGKRTAEGHNGIGSGGSNNGGRLNPSLTARIQTVDQNGRELSAEEIRRQRRMLSNRESARRSRKRKMEHVHVLENQVSQLKEERERLMGRVHELEHRYEVTLRETAAMRAEVDRLHSLLASQGVERQGGAAEPVQPIPARTPSMQNLQHAAATSEANEQAQSVQPLNGNEKQLEDADGSSAPLSAPGNNGSHTVAQHSEHEDKHQQQHAIGKPQGAAMLQRPQQNGGHSFVAFRSVGSYENLLSLHQQERKQYEDVADEDYDNVISAGYNDDDSDLDDSSRR